VGDVEVEVDIDADPDRRRVGLVGGERGDVGCEIDASGTPSVLKVGERASG